MSSSQQGGLAQAFHGLATIVALIGMVFLTPRLWPLIEPQVWIWLIDLYSHEAAWWLLLGGEITTWLMTFLAIRLGLTLGFTVIALLIARRAL